MGHNPFQVVRDFEAAVGEYTGAPYVVAVNSCTNALLLAVAWCLRHDPPYATKYAYGGPVIERRMVEIPRHTYLSVPMSIIHAGGRPTFRDEEWAGAYQLKPLPVWDSARWFTGMMYQQLAYDMPSWPLVSDAEIRPRQTTWAHQHAMICTSHHWSKTLGIQQGGCILLDNPEADAWLRRARYDGRTEGVAPKDDKITQIGYHCYMSPEVAALGLVRMASIPAHNDPLPNDDYPDLSQIEIFKRGE